jgi:hypothetical protein
MSKTKIPIDVQNKVQNIIADFNKKTFPKTTELFYYATFKGDFLYLNRQEGEIDSPIARLKYNGNFTDWSFAIFKWSSEKYDSNEFMFPGVQHANGTIEGALKAGHAAYPPTWSPSEKDLLSFFKQFLSNKKSKL